MTGDTGDQAGLVIDPDSTFPPFEQIKQQIRARRESGEFPAGHRLPTVRRLADELGLVPNTVARAYRELEASGLIETRGRAGSFVTGTAESAEKAGLAAAREYVAVIERLRLGPEDALRLCRAALAER